MRNEFSLLIVGAPTVTGIIGGLVTNSFLDIEGGWQVLAPGILGFLGLGVGMIAEHLHRH